MSDHHANVDVEIGSERGFGFVFTAVFLIIALWPVFGGGSPRWILLAIAGIILALTFLAPQVLAKPNRLWFKFGMLLGAIVAPVVMFLVFITTFVPFGLGGAFVGQRSIVRKARQQCRKLLGRPQGPAWQHETTVLKKGVPDVTFVSELWSFLRVRKKFWLLPIFVMLGVFGGLIVLSQGSAIAPFVYTLF